VEAATLLHQLGALLAHFDQDQRADRAFRHWVGTITARESYRAAVRLGFDGQETGLDLADVAAALTRFRAKLLAGIRQAEGYAPTPPTYFVHQVADYDLIRNEAGEALRDAKGRPFIQIRSLGAGAHVPGTAHAIFEYRTIPCAVPGTFWPPI